MVTLPALPVPVEDAAVERIDFEVVEGSTYAFTPTYGPPRRLDVGSAIAGEAPDSGYGVILLDETPKVAVFDSNDNHVGTRDHDGCHYFPPPHCDPTTQNGDLFTDLICVLGCFSIFFWTPNCLCMILLGIIAG